MVGVPVVGGGRPSTRGANCETAHEWQRLAPSLVEAQVRGALLTDSQDFRLKGKAAP